MKVIFKLTISVLLALANNFSFAEIHEVVSPISTEIPSKEEVFLVPIITIGDLTTNDDSPEITGAVDDPNATLTFNVDGTDYPVLNNQDGTWTLENNTISSLAIGTYTMTLLATDALQETSEATATLTIELGPAEALPATNILFDEFRANWSPRTGVVSYQLEVSRNSDFTNFVIGYGPLETTASGSTLFGLNYSTSYFYRVRAVYADQTLSDYSNVISVKTLVNEGAKADSSALISIYDAMDGPNWVSPTQVANNWKTEPRFYNWNYLIFLQGRVSDANLDEKGLKGDFPVITEGLDQMFSLTLQGNEVTYVPALDNFQRMDNLNLANNKLQFESLENNVGKYPTFFSNPQDSVLEFQDLKAEIGEPITLDRTIRGTQNVYTWFKLEPGSTERVQVGTGETLTIPSVTESDNGDYFVEVTNTTTGLEDVTLVSRKIRLDPSVGLIDILEPTDVGLFGFTASWLPKGSIVSYELEVSRDRDFTTLVAGYAPLRLTNTSEVVTGLNFGTSYYYRVRAEFEGSTFSDYSNTIAVKTLIDPGLSNDSSALLTIYNAIGGENWVNNNWKTDARIYDWTNVGFGGTGRITSLDLNSIGLVGSFPSLETGLELLATMDLGNNELSEIPILSSLTALQTLILSNNNFEFASLENNIGSYSTYTYAPQDSVLTSKEVTAEVGTPIVLSLDRLISGSQNIYTWFRISPVNGEVTEVGTGETLAIQILNVSDIGEYYVEITSALPELAALTLISRKIKLNVTIGTTQPAAPIDIGFFGFSANWFPKVGAVAYELQVSRNRDFTNILAGFDPIRVTDTFAIVNNLNFATSYYYRVRAEYAGNVFTEYSNVIATKTLRDEALRNDSTALLTIYNATGGASWANNNWKSAARIYNWTNIDFSGTTRVKILNLNAAGLKGSFPAIAEGLELLENLDLASNELVDIPVLSNLTLLQSLNVTNNNLEFGFLENNLGSVENYQFNPQDSVSFAEDRLLEIGNTYTLERTIAGSQNAYTWFKQPVDGGDPVAAGTGATIDLNITAFDQEGIYYATVTSGVVGLDQVTLTTKLITVKVSSLQRDVKALKAIYDAAGGTSWTGVEAGWQNLTLETVKDFTSDITLTAEADRVIGINLRGKGLAGRIPKEINDIGGLQTIDVSENNLTTLADMTRLKNLTAVNVSNNFLDFGDLEKNVSLANILTYSPQAKIGQVIDEEIQRGESYTIDIQVEGNNNVYQWTLSNDVVTNSNVPTGNIPEYTIDDIRFENMGRYKLIVTNPLLTALTLESNNISVLATATIGGLITGIDDSPLPSGLLDAFKIGLPNQPYDTADQDVNVVDGAFLTKQLVLGNYLAITSSEILNDEGELLYIPTYLGSTDLWVEADTILLRNDTTIAEYLMTFLPPPPSNPEDLGTVTGVVEAEFDESARILERRKVKKAGCSVRRFRASGRDIKVQDGTFELFAYVETNDNGEFEFSFLPAGLYRFNIEFPGIPMDPDSFVEFEIGASGFDATNFKLEAYITENGIEVERVPPLGTFDDYFNELQVYPIPAVNKLNIKYDLKSDQAVDIVLTDLSGKVVLNKSAEAKSVSALQLDISAFKNGVYVLRFINGTKEEIVSYKVLISH
ncbi:MAG: T9SS type A sorting domain-containing protein [Cyclobacteriaceae bacterium]